MGKDLQHQGTGISIESNHPGCMWGILRVLHHHHRWHHVRKKMLQHKRHVGGRHAVGIGSPGNNINATNAGEMQEHTDAEMNIPRIEEKMTKPTPVSKSSMKSRIKSLIAEEMSKRKGRHHRSSSYPTRMQLTQKDSIHRPEASELNPFAEVASNDANRSIVHQDKENSSSGLQSKACEVPVSSNKKCELCAAMLTVNYMGHSPVGEHGKHPVENDTHLRDKLNKAKKYLLAQKLANAKEFNKDVSIHESKQFLDVLDVFNMNNELFLKLLQEPSSPLAHYFHGRLAFNSKVRFTKSMSFPLTGLSSRSDWGPSKLKHEQVSLTESCAKGEKMTQAEPESTEDTSESLMPLMVDDRIDGVPKQYMAKPKLLDNSTGSPPGPKNRKENKVVIKSFKNLKQKIKHAIRESRKERHRITMDAVLHKIPYGRKFSKDVRGDNAGLQKEPAVDKCCKSSPRSCCKNDGKDGPQKIRKMSSFDKSLDRYRQLYESSFNSEAKHHISERLKLRTEKTPSPRGTAPKTLGRILSLPNLRSYHYLRSEDSPQTPARTDVSSNVSIVSGRFDERKTMTSDLPVGSENETMLDAPIESGSQNNSVELGELDTVAKDEVGLRSFANEEADSKVGFSLDDLGSLTTEETDAQNENEIQVTISPIGKLEEPSPISVINSSQEDMASPTKFSLSEDSRLEPRLIFSDEAESLDSLANQQHDASMDSPTLIERRVNLEKIETSIEQLNSEFFHTLVNTKDVAEFNYVKYVLELSGFSRNELLGAWHSPDHPVDPSMFEEVEEGCPLPEPDYSEHEESGNCHHMLLFDLINEVLLEIYERSFTYWPMPLSSASHIRPAPMGYHVLEEVWSNISWYLSWRPEVDQSLDNAVSWDLAKGDGWMNLQFDTECVGLELEDMIFDNLLEELIWT